MTKAEVCLLLGISERTLQRKMHAGAVKFTKVGGRTEFSLSDLGLPEIEPLAAPQSDDPPKDGPVVPLETASCAAVLPVLPVSQAPTESIPEAATFHDSLGFAIDDPRACTLLGPHPFGTSTEDIRTNIGHEHITYTHGNARVPSRFKENLGYGTTPENLQAEIDFYHRHPRASLRRYGPR
jgi:excisionase family DNA binding protein